MSKKAGVIIIGSGIAGLMTAHLLADFCHVILITKSKLKKSNSYLAQGGIAAAIDRNDHWHHHFTDTLKAGYGHHDEANVEEMVKQGPNIIEQLMKIGVKFDTNEQNQILLGMEGAHQKRRIVHINGDQTGKGIIKQMMVMVQNRITIKEDTLAVQLLKRNQEIIGVKTNKELIYADYTIIASGGAGQIYENTSNCQEATGDGMVLAYQAGAQLKDLEFVQFHPTVLMKEGKPLGLVSEAVRGEGGVLVTANGIPLMSNHPQKDLASRDVVSRAIHHQNINGEKVYLDITSIGNFRARFPSITKLCEKANIQIESGLLEVRPGAHFFNGGIQVNSNGNTTLNRLYAVGEVACTGVHGANRLASNSLLEGLVFSNKIANHIRNRRDFISGIKIETNFFGRDLENQVMWLNKSQIQAWMSRYVGIFRTKESLEIMLSKLRPYESLLNKPTDYMIHDREHLETIHLLQLAFLITESALLRKESRGGHFRDDYLNSDPDWTKTSIIWKRENEMNEVKIEKIQARGEQDESHQIKESVR
ncbi:L-aspartate oxidase [Bacillus sp. TS-2]|nr:L-aspartate oxidase [Bacillus sp. TS-2]